MKKVFLSLFLSAFVAASSFSASAQRQTNGRHSFELYGDIGMISPTVLGVSGGGGTWSNYFYEGRVVWGADACIAPLPLVEEEVTDADGVVLLPEERHDLTSVEITACGGYLFRLWAPRSRVFILSAGASLGLGVRTCDALGSYAKGYSSSGDPSYYIRTGFLINVQPEVQAELFPFRNISAFVSFRPRMTLFCGLGGKVDWFRPMCSFGVKYYL